MSDPYKNKNGEFAKKPTMHLLPPPKGCKRCTGYMCKKRCSDGVIKTLECFPPNSDLCLVCTNDEKAMLPVEPQSNKLTEKKVHELIRDDLAQRLPLALKAALASTEFQEQINKAAKKAILFILQSATPVRKNKVDKPQPYGVESRHA